MLFLSQSKWLTQWQKNTSGSNIKIFPEANIGAWQRAVSLLSPPPLETSFTFAKLKWETWNKTQIPVGHIDYKPHEGRKVIDWMLSNMMGQHLTWIYNEGSSDWIWLFWIKGKVKMKGGILVPLSLKSHPENKRNIYWFLARFANFFIFILPVPALN